MKGRGLARRALLLMAMAAFLLLAGLGSFLVVRQLFRDGKPAEAQPGKLPGQEIHEAVMQDYLKPKFVGELNGIVFFTDEQLESGEFELTQPAACTEDAAREELTGSEVAAAVAGSPLDFEVSGLPPGSVLTFEAAHRCDDTVVNIIRNWGIRGGPQIVVVRAAQPGEFVAEAPRDRLQAATIGGRRAVIMKPIFPGHAAHVYMEDELGHWYVSGFNVDLDTILRIAESLR